MIFLIYYVVMKTLLFGRYTRYPFVLSLRLTTYPASDRCASAFVMGSHDRYRPKRIYLVYMIYDPKFICDN